MWTGDTLGLAFAIRRGCRSGTPPPHRLRQVLRLRRTRLTPPRRQPAHLRAVALTVVAATAQEENPSALAASDRPNSPLHARRKAERVSGRRRGSVQRRKRRSHPRERHRRSGGCSSRPHSSTFRQPTDCRNNQPIPGHQHIWFPTRSVTHPTTYRHEHTTGPDPPGATSQLRTRRPGGSLRRCYWISV